MKKTLIALAALAATGATLAQSSVTIYGRMDLGTASTDVTQRGATPLGLASGAAGSTDTFSLAGAESQRTGSRLGFSGTEDLGGGLRASFVYEIGINADRQTTTRVGTDGNIAVGNAQTRLANLTLSGGFGAVRIGTFMNGFDAARAFSPATPSAPGGDFTQAHGDPLLAQRFDSRSQNAIAYITAFSGFTFSVGAANEDTSTRDTAGVELTRTDGQGLLLGLGYSQGPLAVQLAFGDADSSTRGSANPAFNADVDLRNWVLGVRYTLAPVVLSFIYEDARMTFNHVAAANSFTREFDAWEIGARFPMGAFAPYITFGQGDISHRAGTVVTNTDTSAWQIGTTYNLSTRTSIYAAFGEIELEGANFNRQTDGYRIGLVHTF